MAAADQSEDGESDGPDDLGSVLLRADELIEWAPLASVDKQVLQNERIHACRMRNRRHAVDVANRAMPDAGKCFGQEPSDRA